MADYNFNVTNGKTMIQQPETTSVSDGDYLYVWQDGALKRVSAKNLTSGLSTLSSSGAYAHNSVARGAYLGSSLTDAHSAAIRDGSFDGLYLMDYWTINSINWRIVAFDYYLNTGDTPCTTHHVVVVPDVPLYAVKYNATDTTDGGYVGSDLYKTGLNKAKTIVTAAFGSAHVLTHRNYLHNAVKNGMPIGGAWYDSTVELMTEENIYGNKQWANAISGNASGMDMVEVDTSQYPGFAVARSFQAVHNVWYWLRDVSSASWFSGVYGDSSSNRIGASSVAGVRPAVCIC
ncbi:hypothetical protein ACIA4Q_03960 [Lactobacillus delbrueckii subsp. bulgaricus]